MSSHHHPNQAPAQLTVAIVTVSDTRTPETDESGKLARRMVEEAGHRVTGVEIVADDPGALRAVLESRLAEKNVDAVLLSGGTGISPRDGTFEVVSAMLDKVLPGFGELFRALSYEEIGPGAMLSRAVGGVARGKAVFSMPGSTKAVRLALEKLILPELGHTAGEARKG